MERGEEKGEDGAMGEEDNEILATGVNKPPSAIQQALAGAQTPRETRTGTIRCIQAHNQAQSEDGQVTMQAASEGGASGGSLHRFMVPHWRSRASRCSFISKRCTPQSVAYSGMDSHSRATHSISTGLLPFRSPSLFSLQVLYSYPGFNSCSRTTPIERKESQGPLRFCEIRELNGPDGPSNNLGWSKMKLDKQSTVRPAS